MRTILLAIHPHFADAILDGSKTFEYRRRVAKSKVGKIVLYATGPRSYVLGEVLVHEVLVESVRELWDATKHGAGISKEKFYDYFEGNDNGYAYGLHSPVRYSEPKTLAEFGVQSVPQSFVYIETT